MLLALSVGLSAAQGPSAQTSGASQPPPEPQEELSRAFTYQGQLNRSGTPMNDTCDLRFSLYDAAADGYQVGATLVYTEVVLLNGLFTVSDLDFGGLSFSTGQKRWLEVEVQCPGEAEYTTLTPRQELTVPPYAFYWGSNWEGSGIGLQLDAQNIGLIAAGNSYGVRGTSGNGTGVYGYASGTGVYGRTDSTTGRGVYGYGHSVSGTIYGVYGESDSTSGTGVYGRVTASSGSSYGVMGYSASSAGYGLYGNAAAGSGTTFGLFSRAESESGYAGYFQGRVHVNGTLSKSAGSFKIDHPLDPADKYLYHSFVESPDMMNIYNGVVMLDGEGRVWVTLPEWFEALNGDFRYQLTPIGAPAPDLYIAQEIAGNRFQIAGGPPGIKVSWQVTGIRHDPYAEAHRIPVEEDKPADERGTFLYPELYGRPLELGLDYQRHRLVEEQLDAGEVEP